MLHSTVKKLIIAHIFNHMEFKIRHMQVWILKPEQIIKVREKKYYRRF